MRGFFEPVDNLLDLVEAYCSRCSSDCELLLFKCYWARGGTQLQLNRFREGQNSFTQGYNTLQRAVEKGLITADDDRIAIACGLMGNGCMAMNRFAEAEEWYLKAFQMWDAIDDDAFKDKQLFVDAPAFLGASVADKRRRFRTLQYASPSRAEPMKLKSFCYIA
jgi:hypothetical protein